MTNYNTPAPSRSVMFPADFFDRPAYRRLCRKWPLALAWWMRLVLVAREALFKGQLLVGGQPLSLEDLAEVDPAGIDPDFLAALVKEGWLTGDGDALAIARWSDWYRPPSRMPEAEAARSKARRQAVREEEPEPTVGQPEADRNRPTPTAPNRAEPTTEPTTSTDPIQQPIQHPSQQTSQRAPAREKPGLGRLGNLAKALAHGADDPEAVLARLREHNAKNEARPP